MRTIYITICLLSLLFISCSSDDNSNNLRIDYEENLIETTFRKTGEIPAPIVNWEGNEGVFSATTKTSSNEDDLFRKVLEINPLTGGISWDETLILGKTTIIVTATNSDQTATTKITINNTFISGLFAGGFDDDISEEPDFSTILTTTSMLLSEDGSASLSSFDGTGFEGTGNWTADGPNLTISFTTNDTPSQEIVMKGYLYASKNLPFVNFSGEWGIGLNTNNEIQEVKGIFSFEND